MGNSSRKYNTTVAGVVSTVVVGATVVTAAVVMAAVVMSPEPSS
jgi:hypothetical protein